MTDLLLKLFVKDYNSPEKPEVRERHGTFASIIGIIVNILLATGKLVIGVVVGSIAIVADAVNNFSDAGASIVSFVSFKIAAKPADRDHPFGHARIEYVCSMIVSFLILLVGFELMTESFGGFFSTEEKVIDIGPATYIILSISVLFKLWLSIFYKKVGKRIDSSVLFASSADSISDCISTFAVLVSGIVISFTGWWFIDSIVGLCVSVMIIIAGLKILNETKNSLLGEKPHDEIIESINETVAKYPDVVGIHDMMVHNYGPNHFIASFHAEVDGKKDIYMLHDMIDNIEREINERLGILCTIHMDPIVTDDEEVTRLRTLTESVVSELYVGASIHDFRTVIGHTHTNLIFDIALPYEVKENLGAVIENVSNKIKEYDPTYFCVITIDRH